MTERNCGVTHSGNDSEIDANPKDNFFVADVSGGPQQKYCH